MNPRPIVYGARKPLEGHEALNEHLALSNRYYNDALYVAIARRAAKYFGADVEELKLEAASAMRELYRRYVDAGLGARTIYHLAADANKAAATRWR